jgi:hypothetical protein
MNIFGRKNQDFDLAVFFSFKMVFFTVLVLIQLLNLKKIRQKMYFLYLLQLLNIAIAFFTIIIGLRSFRSLKENRILLFIPILSLFQIILTELKGLGREVEFSNFTLNMISIYIYLEFILIILYFWKLGKNLRLKAFTIALIPIGIVSVIISILSVNEKKPLKVELLSLIEGPIILIIALLLIIKLINDRGLTNYTRDSNLISTLGILFSFMISWPTIIVQTNLFGYSSPFFKLQFIFNSIAYVILFSSISYSFYVTRKYRTI